MTRLPENRAQGPPVRHIAQRDPPRRAGCGRTGLSELRQQGREEGGNDFCLGDGVLKQWMLTMEKQIGVPVEGSEGEGLRKAGVAECLMRATGPSFPFLLPEQALIAEYKRMNKDFGARRRERLRLRRSYRKDYSVFRGILKSNLTFISLRTYKKHSSFFPPSYNGLVLVANGENFPGRGSTAQQLIT